MNEKQRGGIIGYGELMLRLTPTIPGHLLEQTTQLHMEYAGAEANVIGNLAHFGHSVEYITAVSNNPMGNGALRFLRGLGIGLAYVKQKEERLGTYFIEHGVSLRGGRVTYDRAASAFAQHHIPAEKWEEFFNEADYLVLTGISPAISPTCRKNTLTAVKIAKKKGVKVVFDLNYRRSLWPVMEARSAFENILPYVDFLFANVGSVHDIFDFKLGNYGDYEALTAATLEAADVLRNQGDYDLIGMTMRLQEDADHHTLGGLLVQENEIVVSPALSVKILDRIGGGDAFVSGAMHGMIRGWNAERIIHFSSALYAVTQTQYGDLNYLSEEELLYISEGNTEGFVKR